MDDGTSSATAGQQQSKSSTATPTSCEQQQNRLKTTLIEISAVLRTFAEQSRLISKAIDDCIKQNRQTAHVDLNTGPIKLNFDGDIQSPLSTSKATEDTFSPEDEKSLLQPIIKAVKTVAAVFVSVPPKCRQDILKAAISLLLECGQILQLHRLSYYVLMSSQLAWKLVQSMDFPTDHLLLSVGAAYIHAFNALRLYTAAETVLQQVESKIDVDSVDAGDHALLLVEACWLGLFTNKKDVFGDYVQILETRIQGSDTAQSWSRLARTHHCRLQAYAFIAGVYTNPDLDSGRQTPLSLLEKAKVDVVSVTSDVAGFSLGHRRAIGILYLTLCADLTHLLLVIGAPVEASAYSLQGVNLAKKNGSRRWTARFLLFNAQCQFHQSRPAEGHSALRSADLIFSGRTISILPLLKRRQEQVKEDDDVDEMAAAMDRFTLDDGKITRSVSPDYPAGFITQLFLDTGMCRNKKTSEKSHSGTTQKICDCEDCRDFDMLCLKFECAFIKYSSTDHANEKSAIKQKCLDIFNSKFQYVHRLAHKLTQHGIVRVSRTTLMSPLEVPLLKIRLAAAAANFQTMRFPFAKHTEDSDKFEALFENTIKTVRVSRDLAVFNPEMLALADYLDALRLLVKDTKSTGGFYRELKSRWSYDHLAREVEKDDFRGTADGMVIQDSLTSLFGAATISKAVPATPTKHPVIKRDVNPGQAAPVLERVRRRRDAIGPGEAPEVPADMLQELDEQPKMLAKRRMTVLHGEIPSLHEVDIDASGDATSTFADASTEIGKGLSKKALGVLKNLIRSMDRFPLYPYYRNAAALWTMFSGIDENPSKLAKLAICGSSTKLHHLASSIHVRMFSQESCNNNELFDARRATLKSSSVVLKNLPKSIPEDWVICSIAVITQGAVTMNSSADPKVLAICITRWERDAEPITWTVPISTGLSGNFLANLAEIHTQVDENQTSNSRNAKDYWRKRLWLNTEMADLTDTMEKVLGFAKALLLTFPTGAPETKIVKEKIRNLKTKITQYRSVVPRNVVRLLAIAGSVLQKDLVCALTSCLLKLPKNSYIVESLTATACNQSKMFSSPCYQRTPLILIVSNEAYSLPWESIPSLRNHPVSRLPSLQILMMHLEKYQQYVLKHHRGYWILNPDSDLKKTQATFEALFNRLSSEMDWRGVAGKAPPPDEIVDAFNDRNLILYMGHGSGQHIFRLSASRPHRTTASIFLVGCSSVRLQYSTWMDGTGFLEHCVTMGSPCVMGNLWLVTSGCIDEIIAHVLEDLTSKREENAAKRSFLECLALKRDRIRSNYLVGAAPVIIGLPVVY